MRRLLAALVFATWGCDDASDQSPPCNPDSEAPACDPLYEPTFDNLHAQLFAKTCSPAGGSCHASEGAQGGLVLDDPDRAFTGLSARLEPGAPSCSLVVERVTSADPVLQMPPGAPLLDAEICALRQWIHAGALR